MKDFPFFTIFAIGGFVLVIGFVLARSQRSGHWGRLGLGLIALGAAGVALEMVQADVHDDWTHFRDVLLFRAENRREFAAVVYVAFASGIASLLYGIGKRP